MYDFFDVIIMRKNAESVKQNVGWGMTRVPGLIEAGGEGGRGGDVTLS